MIQISTKQNRNGVSAIELLVAATLLMSAIGLIAPFAVRIGRIMKDTRHYDLALGELSNHLERLTSMPPALRAEAIDRAELSQSLLHVFPNATLQAHIEEDPNGTRIVLRLDREPGSEIVPLVLVGWTDTLGQGDTEQVPDLNRAEDQPAKTEGDLP